MADEVRPVFGPCEYCGSESEVYVLDSRGAMVFCCPAQETVWRLREEPMSFTELVQSPEFMRQFERMTLSELANSHVIVAKKFGRGE